MDDGTGFDTNGGDAASPDEGTKSLPMSGTAPRVPASAAAAGLNRARFAAAAIIRSSAGRQTPGRRLAP